LSIVIRREESGDVAAIHRLNIAAFDGRDEEADLVDALRNAGDLVLSLVAEDQDELLGHIAFSRVTIETERGPEGGIALAPVGVHPQRQGAGIGRQLIEAGLEELARLGESVVVVVGDPRYYSRFGFSTELGKQYPCVYSGSSYMAIHLGESTHVVTGPVSYPDAFELVS
jgi:putative acetyltransferase